MPKEVRGHYIVLDVVLEGARFFSAVCKQLGGKIQIFTTFSCEGENTQYTFLNQRYPYHKLSLSVIRVLKQRKQSNLKCSLAVMAIRVVEFSNRVYKIRKIFA